MLVGQGQTRAVKAEIKEIAEETGQTQAEVKASLTPEDIKRIAREEADATYAEKAKAAAEEAAVKENLSKMANLGKELADEFGVPGWGDDKSRLYGMLMQTTSQVLAQKGGNDVLAAMKEAAAIVVEDLQGVAASQLARKKQTAGAGAKASPQRGAEPVGTGKPSSIKDANARVLQRLSAELGN